MSAPALQWWWSQDEERYHGPFASREEAFDAAHEVDDEVTEVHLCTARHGVLRDDIFEADHVFERFEDCNEECWGEGGPDMKTLPVEAVKELEQVLTAAFAAWRVKHAPWLPYNLEDMANQETVALDRPKESAA